MSQKLIQHQIVNYTDVLKWLRKILECRNQFLKRHRSYANLGSQIAICRQAHIKMEVQCFNLNFSVVHLRTLLELVFLNSQNFLKSKDYRA